ncbi:hypothetical protein NXF25_020356 [Crotalus adamanteus]|uniref:Uncharacterized protein n=1 Tax=Crotalus adamanteus TaxID=8729 RepID=A0AAW1B4B2_CROAD
MNWADAERFCTEQRRMCIWSLSKTTEKQPLWT